jgi:hypothetical protein
MLNEVLYDVSGGRYVRLLLPLERAREARNQYRLQLFPTSEIWWIIESILSVLDHVAKGCTQALVLLTSLDDCSALYPIQPYFTSVPYGLTSF